MVAFLSRSCECGKKGPYMGGNNPDKNQWFLACLWCGKMVEVDELVVKEQIRLQQEVGGHSCPNCHAKAPAMAGIPDERVANCKAFKKPIKFTCSNCGFNEYLTHRGFEAYMARLGGRLNG